MFKAQLEELSNNLKHSKNSINFISFDTITKDSKINELKCNTRELSNINVILHQKSLTIEFKDSTRDSIYIDFNNYTHWTYTTLDNEVWHTLSNKISNDYSISLSIAIPLLSIH